MTHPVSGSFSLPTWHILRRSLITYMTHSVSRFRKCLITYMTHSVSGRVSLPTWHILFQEESNYLHDTFCFGIQEVSHYLHDTSCFRKCLITYMTHPVSGSFSLPTWHILFQKESNYLHDTFCFAIQGVSHYLHDTFCFGKSIIPHMVIFKTYSHNVENILCFRERPTPYMTYCILRNRCAGAFPGVYVTSWFEIHLSRG